ncbi:MAG: S41 family peptidase [Chloroflexi bacterium]|nr:S41 family peptidase [Chloroflexota bacterium]
MGLDKAKVALLLTVAALAVVVSGCGRQPASTPTLESTSTPQLPSAERLGMVWQAAGVLDESYVKTGSVSTERLAGGAIEGMLEMAETSPYPLLTRLDEVKGDLPKDVPQGLEDVWRTWVLLLMQKPELDPEAVARSAVDGMALAVGDPLVEVLNAKDYERAREFFEGGYQGIGAVVGEQGDHHIIAAIMSGGPAEQAGLEPGDSILAVNEESADGLTVEELVQRVRGPEGSEVVLTVLREGWAGPREVRVVRGTVQMPTVAGRLLPDNIGYLYIGRFSDNTGQEFLKELRALLDGGARALVLDMRSNPGGSLAGVVDIVSQFVRQGLVYYEMDNDGTRTDWPVKEEGTALGIPLAVLVDEQSASAAEIVAGALQDHHRGRLFGEQTYGKGTLNSFRQLDSGLAIYVAVAHWYTPEGRAIQGQGITPDEGVRPTIDDLRLGRDPVVEAALRYLKAQVGSGTR